MTMSDPEVRAAAEQILAGTECVIKDTKAVARAYLAEHDETEIDEAWLRSVGFVAVQSDMGPTYHDHYEIERLNIWQFNGAGPVNGKWLVNDADWMELSTRRQIRCLCSALGIDLKEPTQ